MSLLSKSYRAVGKAHPKKAPIWARWSLKIYWFQPYKFSWWHFRWTKREIKRLEQELEIKYGKNWTWKSKPLVDN